MSLIRFEKKIMNGRGTGKVSTNVLKCQKYINTQYCIIKCTVVKCTLRLKGILFLDICILKSMLSQFSRTYVLQEYLAENPVKSLRA